ncbi:hypothetical protein [Rhodococcus spongiicola]|uniref:PE domain-containing protein n=1 Tax=Rhodococcus spongiicola TaxID=2487352 RepID=A0A3S3A574_9NOCA|nr:hypothetical protein [Rhodococcus spongiicola]RVW02274.1 hypothetical protein EF834_11660 [Rhodococcus spongiicola]
MWINPSWKELGELVDAGELYLEPGVAEKCAAHCEQLRGELMDLQERARRLASVDGFGHLPSGIALARKFELKASGGDYALDQALGDHIATVEQMQAVFEKIAARFGAAEDANTQALSGIDPDR